MEINWNEYWHYNKKNVMICNRCGAEVWYLYNGYICSSKVSCFNEDDNNGDQTIDTTDSKPIIRNTVRDLW